MKKHARARLLLLAVILGSAGCDHASKQLALSTLAGPGGVSVAGGTLRLELASNPGVFLSLGADLPAGAREILFLGLVPLLVLWLCVHLLRTHEPTARIVVGVGLLAGGGLANWLDRLLHGGAVTDFLMLGLGPLRTGVFNLADVLVVCGVMLLVASALGSRAVRNET